MAAEQEQSVPDADGSSLLQLQNGNGMCIVVQFRSSTAMPRSRSPHGLSAMCIHQRHLGRVMYQVSIGPTTVFVCTGHHDAVVVNAAALTWHPVHTRCPTWLACCAWTPHQHPMLEQLKAARHVQTAPDMRHSRSPPGPG